MSRTLPSGVAAAVAAGAAAPVRLVEFKTTPPVLLHSDIGDLSVGGKTYKGVGELGAMSGVKETRELSAPAVRMQLSGIASSFGSLSDYYETEAIVRLVMRNLATGEPIGGAIELFRGELQPLRIIDGAEGSVIEATIESELIEWDRSPNLYYSDACQQERFAGDRGCQFVERQSNLRLRWGPGQRQAGGGNVRTRPRDWPDEFPGIFPF